MAGMVIIILLALVTIFADQLAPYHFETADFSASFARPSAEHPLGCDKLGRDTLSRVIYGARTSLQIGLGATVIATVVGVVLGAFCGYYGGWIDTIFMRFLDIFQSIPNLLFSIVLAASLGVGVKNAIIAVGITSAPLFARMIRGSIMQIRGSEYIEAARSINARDPRVIIKHIIPNAISPVIVQITMKIGSAIIYGATLSFIGLGAQPPTAEWGAMISEARNYIRNYPALIMYPGAALMICVLAFNLFGDGLRDALDPRLKN
jgi:peptide/nickel transport system permease protein